MDLKKKIIQREAVIEIIGLGYAELPRAREFCTDHFHSTDDDIGMAAAIL